MWMLALSLHLAPAAHAEEPTYWRNHWTRRHAEHLVVDEPVPMPETGPTVLLVPGTTIGPEFYAPMRARLHADGFRTVVFAPEDLFTHSLREGAAAIAAEVERILAETGEERLFVVAECDGGVASRYYAQLLGGDARIAHLVTFVSAHHGTRGAGLAATFSGFEALRDVRRGSAFMEELAAAPFPQGLEMTSIYSCHDPLIKPADTARVEGARNVEFCDKGDKLRHFDGFWDESVYAVIREALTDSSS